MRSTPYDAVFDHQRVFLFPVDRVADRIGAHLADVLAEEFLGVLCRCVDGREWNSGIPFAHPLQLELGPARPELPEPVGLLFLRQRSPQGVSDLVVQDPEDSSKGTFINCIIGWQCAEINRAKLDSYGLLDNYNIISPGSAAALDAVLLGAQEKNEPVFGYYWAPTSLMGAFDWHVLEEPPYTEACWEEVVKAYAEGMVAAHTRTEYRKLKRGGVSKVGKVVVDDVAKPIKRVLNNAETLAERLGFPGPSLRFVPREEAERYAMEDAIMTLRLREVL